MLFQVTTILIAPKDISSAKSYPFATKLFNILRILQSGNRRSSYCVSLYANKRITKRKGKKREFKVKSMS